MLTIRTRFKNFAFFSNPYSSHFLNRFFNLAIDVGSVTIFILVGTNEFITVKVFLGFFTFGTWFQDFTSYGNPDGSHFLNRFVDVGCITILIFVGTNEFITVKVFLRFFTIGTWFQDLTSYSNPNCSYLLNRFLYRFFYWFVDVSSNRTLNLGFNKFITWEGILWFEIWCDYW